MLCDEGVGAIVEGLRICRIETYCCSVVVNGQIQFALTLVNRSEIIMNQRAVRGEPKRLQQVVAGEVEFATIRPDQRPIDVGIRELREQCDRRIEIAERTVAQTECFVGNSAAVEKKSSGADCKRRRQRNRERGLPSDLGQPRSKRFVCTIFPAKKQVWHSTGDFVQQKN